MMEAITNIKEELIAVIDEVLDGTVSIWNREINNLDLINDLGISSITFIMLIIKIEDKFKIEIPSEYLTFEHFKNINELTELINRIIARRCHAKEN